MRILGHQNNLELLERSISRFLTDARERPSKLWSNSEYRAAGDVKSARSGGALVALARLGPPAASPARPKGAGSIGWTRTPRRLPRVARRPDRDRRLTSSRSLRATGRRPTLIEASRDGSTTSRSRPSGRTDAVFKSVTVGDLARRAVRPARRPDLVHLGIQQTKAPRQGSHHEDRLGHHEADRKHAARPAQPGRRGSRPGRRRRREAGVLQPGPLGEGPDRRRHDRGAREGGEDHARTDRPRRADLREHRDRLAFVAAAKGYRLDPDDARDDVDRAPEDPAAPRRRGRPDAGRRTG